MEVDLQIDSQQNEKHLFNKLSGNLVIRVEVTNKILFGKTPAAPTSTEIPEVKKLFQQVQKQVVDPIFLSSVLQQLYIGWMVAAS